MFATGPDHGGDDNDDDDEDNEEEEGEYEELVNFKNKPFSGYLPLKLIC
jgi:hypothetical protein